MPASTQHRYFFFDLLVLCLTMIFALSNIPKAVAQKVNSTTQADTTQPKIFLIEGTIYQIDLDDQPRPDKRKDFVPSKDKPCGYLEVSFVATGRTVTATTNAKGFFQMEFTSLDLDNQATISLVLSKMKSASLGFKGEIRDLVLPVEGGKVVVEGFAWEWFRS